MTDDMIPVPRNSLSYAITALEASSDNGDRYCAMQLREAMFPGLKELMAERQELRRELKGSLFHLVYGVNTPRKYRQAAAEAMAAFQIETDRLRCELTGEDPQELAERRERNAQTFIGELKDALARPLSATQRMAAEESLARFGAHRIREVVGMSAPEKAAAMREGLPLRDAYGKPMTKNAHDEWVNEGGDTPCPNDGEMTNQKCWKCGWVRGRGRG